MHSLDILVQNYFSLTRTPMMTESMFILTTIFNPSAYTFYMFLLVAFLIAIVRNIRYSLFFIFTIFFSSLVVYLMKVSFDVVRPIDGVMYVFGPSFPSFHATIATVFFIILMFVFDEFLNSFMRLVFNVISIVAIFAVALSRVYLGVHWLSDVFFGIMIGCLLSYFYIILFRIMQQSVMNRRASASMLK